MNLARHAAVLWRFRTVTAAGIGFAIIFAVLASYQVRSTGLTPRASATWSATSQLLVTQAGFPEGRVTLPTKETSGSQTSDGEQATPEKLPSPSDQVEFADPGRLAALGDLYSKFLTSDEVLRRVPERPSPDQVVASPFASAQGGQLLPVIELKTMASTGAMARQINDHTFKALRDYLAQRQAANQITDARRVDLKLLVSPKVMLVSGAKPTASVLAFLLVLLGTLAFTHLLEALRIKKQKQALASIVPIDADDEPADERDRLRAGVGGQRLSR